LELYSFDDEYVRRLCDGDRATEEHFFRYFGEALFSKLRRRVRSVDEIDDIAQETMLRALRSVCSEKTLRDGRKLGSFVNSICNNVLFEWFRKTGKSEMPLDEHLYLADARDSAERRLIKLQDKHRVLRALDALETRDAAILRALFIDERDKDEVCRAFGIDRDYLRVLLFRAKEKFRAVWNLQPR